VGATDVYRKTPLHLAAEHDHPEVAELLLDAWTAWGATPLEWAGVMGSRRAGEALLAHGARLTLGCAAGLGRLDAVREMSADGAVSPAFVSAKAGSDTSVLLQPPTVLLQKGQTPLYYYNCAATEGSDPARGLTPL
jgi:ankyrin repeat protein